MDSVTGVPVWLLTVVVLVSIVASAGATAASPASVEQPAAVPTGEQTQDGATTTEEPVPGVTIASIETGNHTDPPRIVELYPNPVAEENVGEFVTVDFPNRTDLGELSLTDDGRQEASPANATVEGTVAFSHHPNETRRHTDHDVHELDGHLQFAEDGDEITLSHNGTSVDSVGYDRAPEAEIWRRDDGGSWEPIDATHHEPVTVHGGDATAFVLPDAPETPIELIGDARERIMLAAYTFSDERVTAELLAAHERGVDVSVTVEASPVGGTTERSADQLDQLAAAGIDVTAFGGDHARYRFHHGKFAVVDDEAIVLTENWKPSGTGGRGNRGWGVITHEEASATAVADVFATDVTRPDAIPWTEYRETVDPVEAEPATNAYRPEFQPERATVERTTLLTAPDNAEEGIRDELDDADESILLTQVSIDGPDDPLLGSVLDAARRGVEVRILLSSAWYTSEENEALDDWLATTAANEDLDIETQLADPRGRYENVHTKGVVIDERTVILGSVNWNAHSLEENREIAVVIEGSDVGTYYAEVFRADWQESRHSLPIGVAVVLVGTLVGVTVLGRREIEFEPIH